jgi:jasmonate ZIM domain-containing protein
MSFKIVQEDKTKNIASDPLMSSGFMNISTADAFDASQKRSMGEIQV